MLVIHLKQFIGRLRTEFTVSDAAEALRHVCTFTRIRARAFAHLTISYNLYARLEIIIHFAARRMTEIEVEITIMSAANFCPQNSFVIFSDMELPSLNSHIFTGFDRIKRERDIFLLSIILQINTS